MNKKIVVFLFLALSISWSVLAASQPEKDKSEKENGEVHVENPSEPLDSGIGWKLMRSIEMGNTGKFVNMVLIEQDRYTDKTIYSAAISKLCRGQDEFCRIRFWSQERFIPDRISITTEQYQQLKAEHLFNRTAGMHRLQWSCSVDPNSEDCIAQ
ncbi:MAG: hypothetical protein Q8K59_06715 [Nitrosomonas sp.]|nr:hypothetical protein [Nitrosomonas sp.]MDP1950771.1 hypothetical protein [Nitrosomonas sp.]